MQYDSRRHVEEGLIYKTVIKEFLQYAALNVLGMLGVSCYILADTFFIAGGLGSNGLAALNLALPIYNLLKGCGMMLGIGSAVKYSIYREQGKEEQTRQLYGTTILTADLLGIVFLCAGAVGAEGIAGLLGADDVVRDMTATYLRMMLLFAPVFLLNDIGISYVRNDGNPRLAMAAMITSSFTNIVLDYIFIFPMQLGMWGAIFATCLAPCISIGMLLFHCIGNSVGIPIQQKAKMRTSRRGRLCVASARARKCATGAHFIFVIGKRARPDVKGFHISMLKEVGKLGFSSFVTELSSGIVIIVFNMILLHIRGNLAIAAYGVIANISLVVMAMFTGVAQGMQPVVSRLYGRGDTAGRKKVLHCACGVSVGLAAVIYLLLWFGNRDIIALFNSRQDAELAAIASVGMKIYFAAAPFAAVNIVCAMYFAAVERALPAQVISLLRGCLLIIPAAFLLAGLLGMIGVWLSFPVTEGSVMLVGVMMYVTMEKRTGGVKKER